MANGNLKKKSNKSNQIKNLGLYLLIALTGLFVFYNFGLANPEPKLKEKSISTVLSEIKAGNVEKILIEGDLIKVSLKGGENFQSRKEKGESFVKILETAAINPKDANLEVKDTSRSEIIFSLINLFLPIIVIVLIFFFISRQARVAGDTLFSFARSRAKLFNKDKPSIKFSDVAGVDEAKKELQEIVEFLKSPEKFRVLGAKIPKGALLVGPSGVGKTLLARAVAGEAGVPFFSIAGSEFMEMLVGIGASRVRDLFEKDWFETNVNFIVMAGTNRPDMLDPALVRPGRFDPRVTLDLPDIEGRKEIIRIHSRNKPLAADIDFEKIARRTVGFSGADIENMLNEAAILAARHGKRSIDGSDIEEATLKVQLGPERKRLTSEEEKKITAYHEAGHALTTKLLPHMDPVHRISIVARGPTGGHTLIPPTQDRYNETKTHLEETITSLLGGRAAEEIEFNEFTVGASSDIKRATDIARKMVTEFGMSSLGPLTTGVHGENPWLARELGDPKPLSEHLAAQVDDEVKRIIDESFAQAKKILRENKEKLDLVATELIKKETLEGQEFEEIVSKGEKLHQVKEKIEEPKEEPQILVEAKSPDREVKS